MHFVVPNQFTLNLSLHKSFVFSPGIFWTQGLLHPYIYLFAAAFTDSAKTHSLSLSLSFSLTHTLTHTLTHSHALTHTHTQIHTHVHESVVLSLAPCPFSSSEILRWNQIRQFHQHSTSSFYKRRSQKCNKAA